MYSPIRLYQKLALFFSGLERDSRGRFFMDIWDKVDTAQTLGEDERERERRYCPPHRWPNSLPIIHPKVEDEPCHFHQTDWRQHSHHEPFCRILRCPHYNDMKRARD